MSASGKRTARLAGVSRLASSPGARQPCAGSGRIAGLLKIALASVATLAMANCAKQPQRSASNSREIGAFSDPKYGKASPRVVGMDEDAPKGGGRYQVGQPYSIAGKRYVPRENPKGYTAAGLSSWYGIAFHGRKTANGEVYDRNAVSAAHPTMPLPSYARVTNTRNNHSIVVRVNDRGPYHGGRVIDVSERAATLLNFKHMGTTRVKIDYLGPASLAGSDDSKLVASLRTDGPAPPLGTYAGPVMVASSQPVASARPPAENEEEGGSRLAFAPQNATFSANAPAFPVSRPPLAPGVITETRFLPVSNLPLPPQRPFDLETIGGAAVPVAPNSLPISANGQTAPTGLLSLPKVSPTSLAFIANVATPSRFRKDHALARLGALELK